jgi:hypothetical protein
VADHRIKVRHTLTCFKHVYEGHPPGELYRGLSTSIILLLRCPLPTVELRRASRIVPRRPVSVTERCATPSFLTGALDGGLGGPFARTALIPGDFDSGGGCLSRPAGAESGETRVHVIPAHISVPPGGAGGATGRIGAV